MRYITGGNKYRVGHNYLEHENKYNFASISFQTQVHVLKVIEKNNPGVSVNVYGLEKKEEKISYLTSLTNQIRR